MATERIEEGDYGVEIITASKPVAAAAPAKQEEEKKVAPAAVKPTAAAAAKAPVRQAPEDDDELDEDEMFGAGTTFAGVKDDDDGFQVEEGKQMTETLVVFERN